MLKKLRFNKNTTRITSAWGLNKVEADANYIRVEKSVMSKFKRYQVVKIKNLDTDDVIYAPIRGAGEQHPNMYRSTVAMSYDNRSRLGIKGSKSLNLQISEASWFSLWIKSLMRSNSPDAAANQASLMVGILALVIAAISSM